MAVPVYGVRTEGTDKVALDVMPTLLARNEEGGKNLSVAYPEPTPPPLKTPMRKLPKKGRDESGEWLPDAPTFVSVCSGVGGLDQGLEAAGVRGTFLCEIDAKCRAVLRYRFPGLPIHDDLRTLEASDMPKADLLVGGPPCQDFSIAGLRKGLKGARGNLTLTYAALCDEYDPETIFFENVHGILNHKTNPFGSFLAALAGHDSPIPGPDRGRWPNAGVVAGPRRQVAYRTVDSQGWVPQRRRRVLVVATRNGSGLDPVRMLFETEDKALAGVEQGLWAGVFAVPEGGGGNPAPGGEAGEGAAGDASDSAGERTGAQVAFSATSNSEFSEDSDTAATMLSRQYKQPTHVVAVGFAQNQSGDLLANEETIHALATNGNATGRNAPTVAYPIDAQAMRPGTAQTPSPDAEGRIRLRDPGLGVYADGEPSPTLQTSSVHAVAYDEPIAFDPNNVTNPNNRSNPQPGDPCHTLHGGYVPPTVILQWIVRRLMPKECEKLQGWSPGWTQIGLDENGKRIKFANGVRYKMVGNGVTSWVAYWLGSRYMKERRRRDARLARKALETT